MTDTIEMRICSRCANILSIINIGPVAWAICWRCKGKSFLGEDFFADVEQDKIDFNDVESLWIRRSFMIQDYEEIPYVERIEQLSLPEIMDFLKNNRERILWQAHYRK
jgi:hypothetical protein